MLAGAAATFDVPLVCTALLSVGLVWLALSTGA